MLGLAEVVLQRRRGSPSGGPCWPGACCTGAALRGLILRPLLLCHAVDVVELDRVDADQPGFLERGPASPRAGTPASSAAPRCSGWSRRVGLMFSQYSSGKWLSGLPNRQPSQLWSNACISGKSGPPGLGRAGVDVADRPARPARGSPGPPRSSAPSSPAASSTCRPAGCRCRTRSARPCGRSRRTCRSPRC